MPVALVGAGVVAPVLVVTLVAEVEVGNSPVPRPRDAFTSCPHGTGLRFLQLRQLVLAARAERRPSRHGPGWVEAGPELEPIPRNRTGEMIDLCRAG